MNSDVGIHQKWNSFGSLRSSGTGVWMYGLQHCNGKKADVAQSLEELPIHVISIQISARLTVLQVLSADS